VRLAQPGTLAARMGHQALDSAAGSISQPFAALDRFGSDEIPDYYPTRRRSARENRKNICSVLLRRERHA